MPTDRQGQSLPVWLDAVLQDDVPSLHTIAVGIDRDINDVIVGIALPWNSGIGSYGGDGSASPAVPLTGSGDSQAAGLAVSGGLRRTAGMGLGSRRIGW
jgi:hypothetical protein